MESIFILSYIFFMLSVLPEFVKHVSMLQIANSQDAATRLFQALTMNPKMEGKRICHKILPQTSVTLNC